MDWQKNRLLIAAVVLVVMGGLAVVLYQRGTGSTPVSESERPTLPAVVRDDVTAIDITRPAPSGEGPAEQVRLSLHDGVWRVSSGDVDALADPSAIDTVFEKLTGLEVAGTAATHADHHAELEVDDEHGVHVTVHGAGDAVMADLIIGAFRGGNTMVRVAGQDTVVTVRGSIRFAFARDLKDWRNRSMLDLEADQVSSAEWVGPNGTFRFARPQVAAEAPPPPAEGEEAPPAPATHLGDWAPTAVSYVPMAEGDAGVVPVAAAPVTTLANFAPSRLTSMVSSLAHMRASDFAAAGVDRATAGITESSPRVTLTVGTERHTITVGSEATSGNFYAVRNDDPTIFVISRFLMEKVAPAASAFEQTAAAAAEAPPDDGAPPSMPGGGDIPPDLMRQIQAQLQAQGLGGGGP